MAVVVTPSTPVDTLPKRPNALWQFIKTQPLGLVGFLTITLYVVCAFGANWISPFDPEAIDFSAMLASPGAEHWFGTDQYGRDVFSRIVYGSRTALAVGIISAVAGCTLGALLGAASGYFGGRIDNAIQRLVDVMLSFPIIVLAMVVVAVLGKRQLLGIDFNLIAAITLPIVPRMERVARASTLSILAMPFIDAARGGLQPHTHHSAPHHPQYRRALPHHGFGLHGAGDPLGGKLFVPGPRRNGAHSGLGADAVGRERRLLPDRALDD